MELQSSRVLEVFPTSSLPPGICFGWINSWSIQRLPTSPNLTLLSGELWKQSQLSVLYTQNFLQNLMIDTVDAFQGREKEYIILSCVRSGDTETTFLGFLNDQRRLNVAITRAKKGVIVVGNRTLLDKSDAWKDVIKSYVHIDQLTALERLGVTNMHQRNVQPNCTYCDSLQTSGTFGVGGGLSTSTSTENENSSIKVKDPWGVPIRALSSVVRCELWSKIWFFRRHWKKISKH